MNHADRGARTLENDVYELSIYISEDDNPWSYKDKLSVLRNQRISQDWLKTQAANYGTTLNFHEGCYGLDQDICMKSIPPAKGGPAECSYWIEYLFDILNYKPMDFIDWVFDKYSCPNVHVLIYANQIGRSYAMPFSNGGDKRHFLEGTILYRYFTNGIEYLDPHVIAHEILHLYGAWDLYQTHEQTYDRENMAKQHFSNDIMHQSGDLNELQVGPLTAWLVGWNKCPEEWYEWFRPMGY